LLENKCFECSIESDLHPNLIFEDTKEELETKFNGSRLKLYKYYLEHPEDSKEI
jgi:hypothetical protein